MKERGEKRYCTLDHADKAGELARQSRYLLRLKQAARPDATEAAPGKSTARGQRARPGR